MASGTSTASCIPAPPPPPLLLNPLLTSSQILSSPSSHLPLDLVHDLLAYGAQFIHRLSSLLDLPQRLAATSQVLFQRFFATTSPDKFGVLDAAMACVYLGAKVEECTARLRVRDLINCSDWLIDRDRWAENQAKEKNRGHGWMGRLREKEVHQTPDRLSTASPSLSSSSPDFVYRPHAYHSSIFYSYKDTIVFHEMHILKRLGFHLEVQLPYATLVNYLNILGVGKDKEVVEACWGFCSDMLQTPCPVLFQPHVLSLSSIYFLSLLPSSPLPPLPRNPYPWWTLFDVTVGEMRVVCSWLMRLYDEHEGTASRVREEWGGMVSLANKDGMREWVRRRDQCEGQLDEDKEKDLQLDGREIPPPG